MSDWSALFWLIVAIIIMYPLKRWISVHVQGVAFLITASPQLSLWLFWALFLPGTVLHEVSHWLTAVLLGVKTGGFSVWPKLKKKGELQMGAVQVEEADPFRFSLIGLAPLIFGSAAVLLIGQGQLELGRLGEAITTGNVNAMRWAISRTLGVPDVWLWLYLLFAISNAMLPSASDRTAWRTVLIYSGVAFLLAVGLGFNPTMPIQLQEIVLLGLAWLLSAFITTLAVDVFFIAIIMVTENLLAWTLGRRVQYN
jgi:hypothetical protein